MSGGRCVHGFAASRPMNRRFRSSSSNRTEGKRPGSCRRYVYGGRVAPFLARVFPRWCAALRSAASMRRSVCVVPSPLCCFVFRCVSFLCVDLLSLVSAAVWLRRVRCYPARPVAALFGPLYTCSSCFVHSIVSFFPIPAPPLYLVPSHRWLRWPRFRRRMLRTPVDRSSGRSIE